MTSPAPLTPTATPKVSRFFARGVSRCVFCTELDNPQAPTRAELSAGVDLSNELAEWAGWSVATDFIDTPDLASRFNSKINGTTSAADSSVTLYSDKMGVDAREVLVRDATGYMVFLDAGLTSAICDVFEVAVGSAEKDRGFTGAAMIKYGFAILSEPVQDAPIAAA